MSTRLTNFDVAVIVFLVVGFLGTLIVRFSQEGRSSSFIRRPRAPWPESIKGGAMLGMIAAFVYVIGAVADWSKLWK